VNDGNSGGNYTVTQADNSTSTISKANLTVSTINVTKTYDGSLTAAGVAIVTSGTLYSNASNSNTQDSLSGGSFAFTNANAGTGIKTVSVSGITVSDGYSGGNYTVTQADNSTSTISKTNLTVSTSNVTKTYDGSLTATGVATVTSGTLYTNASNGNGSTQDSLSSGSFAFTNANAGTGNKTVSVSGINVNDGNSGGNYTVTQVDNSTSTISKAHLSVTADNQARLYGAANPTLTTTVSGFVNGQDTTTAAGFAGAGSASTTATTATNVGSAVITASSGNLAATNYDFTNLVDGALTIGKAHLTVTADNQARLYGAANPTLTTTVSGFVNGQDTTTAAGFAGAGSASTTATTTTNVGSAVITASAGNLAATNYDFTNLVDGTLSIKQRPLTVSADPKNKTYGDANPALTYTVAADGVGSSRGLVNADSLSGALSATATTGSGVGSYTIDANALANGNYLIMVNNGALTITPAPLVVTAANASKTYDGAGYSGGNGVVYSGFVNSETAAVLSGTLAYTGTSQGAKNVGSYVITPTGLASSNYEVSFQDGSLTISPAALSAIVASLTGSTSKGYDGNTAATLTPGNFSLSGFATGEGASVTKTSGTFDTAGAGTGKTVTASLSGSDYAANSGTLLSNYTLPTSASGTIGTITKTPLTVTASNDAKTYNAVAYAGGNGVTYNGFVNGETATALSGTLAYTGTSQSARNAGNYLITPAGLVSSNYAVSYVNGSLTITPAPLTLTVATNSKSFDGNTSAQVLPLVAGLIGSDTVTNLSEAYADSNPGNGKTLTVQTGYVIADGNGGGNYTVALVSDASGVIRALPVAVLPPAIPPTVAPIATPPITITPVEVASVAPVTQITPAPQTTQTPSATPVSSVGAGSGTGTAGTASGGSTAPTPSGNSSPGVTVSAINQATQQTPGLVLVQVPAGSSTSGAGLSITLPESLFTAMQQASAPERVTLPDQQPLPSWIRYDAASKTLITGAVPAGALPITVWVTVGGQTTLVQVSETQANL
jgi:hypothetical protein